jgi:hypothetical protein
MSAEVTLALTGVVVVALALFTVAAFKYVPMTLAEEEDEEEGLEQSRRPVS